MTIYRDPKPVKCPRCLGSGLSQMQVNVSLKRDLDKCYTCGGIGSVKVVVIFPDNYSLEDMIKHLCIRSGIQEDEIDLSYFVPQPKRKEKDEIKPDLMRKKIRDWA